MVQEIYTWPCLSGSPAVHMSSVVLHQPKALTLMRSSAFKDASHIRGAHLALFAWVPCCPGLVLRGCSCYVLVDSRVVALHKGDVEQLAVLLDGPHCSQGPVEEDGMQHACSGAQLLSRSQVQACARTAANLQRRTSRI